jgi:hypothetical protein
MSVGCGILIVVKRRTMRQELHFTNNSPEFQKEVLAELITIAEGNFKAEENGEPTQGFTRSFGYIAFEGSWGLVRGDETDVLALSEKHPEETFSLFRDFQRQVTTSIEDLSGHFSKIDIKNGNIVAVYQPANITWVQV